MDTVLIGILIPLVLGMIAGQGIILRRLGNLETAIKKACPFGKCPVFERAINEAAPKRENRE